MTAICIACIQFAFVVLLLSKDDGSGSIFTMSQAVLTPLCLLTFRWFYLSFFLPLFGGLSADMQQIILA